MLLSIRAYAKHRGVVESAVRRAISDGRITTTGGKIDPDVADAQWTKNTNPAYHPNRASDDGVQSMSNRHKKETLDILLKKLEYEEKSGKLISLAVAEADAFAAARLARDRLQTIPDRVVPLLIGKTDIFEMKQILKKEILESLAELTEFLNGNKS